MFKEKSTVRAMTLLFFLAALPLLASGGATAQDSLKVEVVPQVGHFAFVISVAFSPDGRKVLSGGGDTTLRLWDAATGRLVRTFEGHSKAVVSVAFSPDAQSVLSGSSDNTLKLWDTVTGRLLRSFEGHSAAVYSVAFSPDGRTVLSGSSDKTLKLWEVATGGLLHTFEGHSDGVRSVAFALDGRRVLSGSMDQTLKLWDVATGQLLRTFEGQSGVRSVAFSPDGYSAASGGDDATVSLWDVATGQLLRSAKGHVGGVSSVAYSPDGSSVLSGSSLYLGSGQPLMIKLWDAATGDLVRTFEERSWVTSVAFSPDGRSVLSGGWDSTLKLWDVATGRLLRSFEGHSKAVVSIFSSDGHRLLSGGTDKTVRIWDSTTGRLLRRFEGHSKAVVSVAFSPDGQSVLSGSEDNTLKLWNPATGQLLRSFEGDSATVYSVAFSPDGRTVLSGGADKTLKIREVATGELLRTFEGHSDWVRSVAFSPDGLSVLSGSMDQTLKLWDVATGQLLRTFEGHSGVVGSVAFSPDGRSVLSGSGDTTLKLWDRATGLLAATFQGHSVYVGAVVFSPDGRKVLSSGGDATLKLWDVATGRLVASIHSGWVTSVAFSPSGRRIISAGGDGTIRFWSVPDGREIMRLLASPKGDWLAIAPAGFFDAKGDVDKAAHLVRGLETFSISQVHQSLYNPDLVRAALAGDPDGEVEAASKLINLDKVVASGPAPTVLLVAPARSATDLVTAQAHITDRGKGVGRIEWRVNGITAAVLNKAEGSGPTYTATKQLALDPGDNTVEVIAYNASNLLASPPARTTVKFTGPADRAKPKLHILSIGINDYIDPGWTPPGQTKPEGFGPLGLAVKDATAFAAAMKQATAGMYDDVRVTLALDRDATRANLHKLIDKLAAEIHPRDSFILFAAAHGQSENGQFYLIAQDYQSGAGHLQRLAIGQDDLQDWLANRIKARKALILLDTCESGALVAGHIRSRIDAPVTEAGVGRLHEATGHPVLAAAALGQEAKEGVIAKTGQSHGYFTYALLDALRHGDTNANGLIELSELVAHVQAAVPKIAAGKSIRGLATISAADKQSARFGSRGGDYVLAKRLN